MFSEDNASFEELSALMAERHRNKISWMYKAEQEHNEGKVIVISHFTIIDVRSDSVHLSSDFRLLVERQSHSTLMSS